VILAEGVFDAIGEYSMDTLKLKDKARLYVAGLSYSYDSLLKGVCFDNQLFTASVVILSDRNIAPGLYYKLQKYGKHVIKDLKVYYNRNSGGDFGSFPIVPFELKLEQRKKRYGYKQRKA
jgi:hypothetical protein